MSDVLILGASIAGLATALFAAKSGLQVQILEQDPNSHPNNVDDCLINWIRRKVPQFGMGHAFHGLGRSILRKRAPEVLGELLDNGALELRHYERIPHVERLKSDEDFCAIMMRRPFFEWHLRQAVLREQKVEFVSPCRAENISFSPTTFSKVKCSNKREFIAPWIVDATGRRSFLSQQLSSVKNITTPIETEKIPSKYAAVHFKFHKLSSQPAGDWIFGPTGDLGFIRYSLLPEDNGYFVLTLNVTSNDLSFSTLSKYNEWMKIASQFTDLFCWIDPSISERQTSVFRMANIQNQIFDFRKINFDSLSSFVPIGDAFCVTNPTQGWGMSLALLHADTVVRGIVSGVPSHQLRNTLYDTTKPFFDIAVGEDRERKIISEGLESDWLKPENPLFVRKVVYPISHQSVDLYRATQRRIHLLDHSSLFTNDTQLAETAMQIYNKKMYRDKG